MDAPNSGQMFMYPVMPSPIPSTTVRTEEKYGLTRTFLKPFASATVSPGASQNSWNVYLASLVEVSSEVRQKTEIARIRSERITFSAPERPGRTATIFAIPMENTCIGFVVVPDEKSFQR